MILLFQPAEEPGKGAYDVLNDYKFKNIQPDYIFALHNIPGKPLNSVIFVKNNFSSTVHSVSIHLTGKESHSAQPEQGTNPALCIAELINKLDKLNNNDVNSDDFALIIPIYSNMGKKSYGISAGYGEIHYTLRTRNTARMEKLKTQIDKILLNVTKKHRLKFSLKWFDYFPSVVNDKFCNELIIKAAQKNKLALIEKSSPFRFGE
ncbi:peptidase dimerization domain-containing protein, partial [candidate division KSB1 bacterium]|nr:peptidase dimerization domain-containing protein [candidate division KSB1 bacterium]